MKVKTTSCDEFKNKLSAVLSLVALACSELFGWNSKKNDNKGLASAVGKWKDFEDIEKDVLEARSSSRNDVARKNPIP